jgi:hypothetical protein
MEEENSNFEHQYQALSLIMHSLLSKKKRKSVTTPQKREKTTPAHQHYLRLPFAFAVPEEFLELPPPPCLLPLSSNDVRFVFDGDSSSSLSSVRPARLCEFDSIS